MSQTSTNPFDFLYNTTLSTTSGTKVDATHTTSFCIVDKATPSTGGSHASMSMQVSSRKNNTMPPEMYVLYGLQRALNATEHSRITYSYTNGSGRPRTTTLRWLNERRSYVILMFLPRWICNYRAGIRTYPYTTSPVLLHPPGRMVRSCHPSITTQYPDIGEAWINMLQDIYAALIEVHAFSSTAIDDIKDNIVSLHLFIDTLSLKPCDPMLSQQPPEVPNQPCESLFFS
ncbi:hypothetical protein ARMGADRAFT_1077811 [Armillaria gallica]|uniref:Extracellular metalloproteinase n=1 Tax=Armillaria gallica TaxID=47427 RepID=A0A2H3DLU5_ARMGA|nr:hypothetical protein ARMGADRAFT_1077811 [Armillaria gallica]